VCGGLAAAALTRWQGGWKGGEGGGVRFSDVIRLYAVRHDEPVWVRPLHAQAAALERLVDGGLLTDAEIWRIRDELSARMQAGDRQAAEAAALQATRSGGA